MSATTDKIKGNWNQVRENSKKNLESWLKTIWPTAKEWKSNSLVRFRKKQEKPRKKLKTLLIKSDNLYHEKPANEPVFFLRNNFKKSDDLTWKGINFCLI